MHRFKNSYQMSLGNAVGMTLCVFIISYNYFVIIFCLIVQLKLLCAIFCRLRFLDCRIFCS